MEPELLVYPDRCAHCGACVGFDPVLASRGLPPAREALSLKSADTCFSGGLQIAGREMSAAEVFAELEQDADYYRSSGGGITLSGGEACIQAAFAKEILTLCREKNISTAIETNLAYDYSVLEALLPLLDLVMADVKLADDGLHREFTGAGNAQILENRIRLARSGIPYIIRTPVIPGINDTAAEISAIAELIAREPGNMLYYELLNFNPLGASKYGALGKGNPCEKLRPLPEKIMKDLAAAAERAGITVRVG